MSDYFGAATLEDWLAEEVFHVSPNAIPPYVVAKFEEWREPVENNIQAWMDSDDGDGNSLSWRGWGRGFIPIQDGGEGEKRFDQLVADNQPDTWSQSLLKTAVQNQRKAHGDRTLSCLGLEFLCHCHWSPLPTNIPDTPAKSSMIDEFSNAGVIRKRIVDGEFKGAYELTDFGNAWLTAILATPPPVQKQVWVDPRTGQEIKDG